MGDTCIDDRGGRGGRGSSSGGEVYNGESGCDSDDSVMNLRELGHRKTRAERGQERIREDRRR